MTTTGRRQQRYDHRLRDLVHGTGDITIATDLGVPRSTARGWLGKAPKVVVSLDVTDLKASELRQEVLELRRRVKKLTALLRLTLALLQSSGFTLTHERLPDGRAKIRILPAVGSCRAVSTDILHLPARVVVTAADRLTSADGPQCPRVVERRQRTADDHPHDDHGAPSAALRPSASGSRPGHRGRGHRHGSRGSSLERPVGGSLRRLRR